MVERPQRIRTGQVEVSFPNRRRWLLPVGAGSGSGVPLCVPEGSLPQVVPLMFAFLCAVLFVGCAIWLIIALTRNRRR